MSTDKKNIYQKLLSIQKKVKGLSKDKQSHNYGYVTGNKLLSFIKPLMDQEGLILKQEITEIENVRQDYEVFSKWDLNADGTKGKWKPKNEIFSKVMMKFTWVDCETGEMDVNTFGANGQNDWEKGLGSALTYGERYFLLKYFHIATDEDDIDNPDRKPVEPTPKTVAKETPKPVAKSAVKTTAPANDLAGMEAKFIRLAMEEGSLTDKLVGFIVKARDTYKWNHSRIIELLNTAKIQTKKEVKDL